MLYRLVRPTALAATVGLALGSAATAQVAAPLVGTSASTVFGQRASFGGVTTVGATVGASDGGDGTTSAAIATTHARGTAEGAAEAGTLSPSARGRSASNTSDDVARGNAGAFGAYRYDGPTAGTVVFSYVFTANTAAPVDSDTFMRAQGAIIRDAEYIAYGVSSYAEGGGNVLDSFRYDHGDEDGPNYNTPGTLSATIQPGEVFNVMLGLQTSAGGPGAVADAFSTLQGTLTTSTVGGSLTVVPEPASLALLAFGGAMLTVRRRRAA